MLTNIESEVKNIMESKSYTPTDIANELERLQWKLDHEEEYDIYDITTEELWCLNTAISILKNKNKNEQVEHESELYGSTV
jgi:hypothetical protein